MVFLSGGTLTVASLIGFIRRTDELRPSLQVTVKRTAASR
jgi:hypothetical protein